MVFAVILKHNFRRSLLIAAGLFLGIHSSTSAQDGEAIFKKNCAMCHFVGGGRLVGPDLIGVTTKRSEDWLMKWTKSSQTLIKSGDKDAKAIFDEYAGVIMPDQNIPDGDIKAIYAFIASKSSAAPATVSADTVKKEAVPDASNKATAEDIERGKNIFVGSVALANGGPSCISCHNVNYKGVMPGGLLAKDLTDVFSRMGGDAGIHGIMGAPPFPAMTQAYKDHPLTDKEIADITAFLNKVDKDKSNQVVASANPLLAGGAIGTSVLFILIFVIWHARKRFSVKKDIYNRQIKSI